MSGIGADFFASLKAAVAKWPKEHVIQCRFITEDGGTLLVEQKITKAQFKHILDVLELTKPKTLEELQPRLQWVFDRYLDTQRGDGDRQTFADWLEDEAPHLDHRIDCPCDCHANNSSWPGPHCKRCTPKKSTELEK